MDYSLRTASAQNAKLMVSLNPYSNGLLSEAMIGMALNIVINVLILILMDYSLSFYTSEGGAYINVS